MGFSFHTLDGGTTLTLSLMPQVRVRVLDANLGLITVPTKLNRSGSRDRENYWGSARRLLTQVSVQNPDANLGHQAPGSVLYGHRV